MNHAVAAPPKFGRYVGVLRHENIQREQLAKLDLIPSQEEGNNILLNALLIQKNPQDRLKPLKCTAEVKSGSDDLGD